MSTSQTRRREALLREVERQLRRRSAARAERRAATLRAAARLRWAASTSTSYGRH